MSDSPKFSIITITKDNEAGLRATLDSVAAQANRDFELIIIDGNSKDGTVELIQEYESDVDCVEQDSGEGIYAAMNQGVATASGEWVIFMNSGDSFADANVLRDFDSEITSDLAFGRAQNRDASPKHPFEGFDRIWRNMPFSHQALFCRRELLMKRPFNIRYQIAADFDFVLHAYKRGYVFEELDLLVAIVDVAGVSDAKIVRRVFECYCAAFKRHFLNLKMHYYYIKKLRWAFLLSRSK